MICPKCRKIYPLGIQSCPECGSQLIALMGEADAPIDENNDNISSLDRVFGGDFESKTVDVLQQNDEAFDDSIEEYEPVDDKLEAEAEFELEPFEESLAELEEETEQTIADEEYPETETEIEAEDDVKIFVSSDSESFEVSNSICAESCEIPAPAYYEEEYEVNFNTDEQEYDEYESTSEPNIIDEEKEQENEKPETAIYNETHIGSATVYKAASNAKRAASAKEENINGGVSEKTTNAISIFIFAAAVLMIIASVVCFALGNTTELSEMMAESIFAVTFSFLN